MILSPLLATVVFWTVFGACVTDIPEEPDEPAARVVASWDPLLCGDPHRVVVELEDSDGVEISSSAPCWLGGVTLDAPRWGIYSGRVYTWVLGEPIRSIMRVTVTVDAPVIRWQLTTPP